MNPFSIGVVLDCLRLDWRTAIQKAADMGAEGIQIYATTPDFNPQCLGAAEQADFLDRLNSAGLRLTALCGDFGAGFGSRVRNPEMLEKSKRVLELACRLGTGIVTTHIGLIPQDSTQARYKIMQEACADLAVYAGKLGVRVAVETGPEPSRVLKDFLDSLPSGGMAVNLDPANMVMFSGESPAHAVGVLNEYIVHTHAKDGIKLRNVDLEAFFGAKPMAENLPEGEVFSELPLGRGDVNWREYLQALAAIGYRGFLTIEREAGDQREEDIRQGVLFLRNMLSSDWPGS